MSLVGFMREFVYCVATGRVGIAFDGRKCDEPRVYLTLFVEVSTWVQNLPVLHGESTHFKAFVPNIWPLLQCYLLIKL